MSFSDGLHRVFKFSGTKTFLSSLLPRKEYVHDTNLHGGERAFVLTGVYEKVLAHGYLPMHLLKSILAGDIEADGKAWYL
jgi:Na+-transporting NADH:ubiquinone oxidoreductase subunit A